MDFKQIVSSRYATKQFDGRTVPEDKLDALLDLVRLAPSSFNLQPWKILIVTDAATKQRLAPAAWNQPQITTASHLLVFLADTDLEGLIARMDAQMKTEGTDDARREGFIAMVSGFAARMDATQRKAWAQRQVYLALGNALNGAKSLGLDSCPMEGFDPAAFSEILGLPAHLVPTTVCPIGYAADVPSAKVRFEKDYIVLNRAVAALPSTA